MHEELQKLNQALERGQSEDDAIRHFAGSVTHPDIALFRMAIILARRQGASLGDTLHRLTRVTRLRQSFRRRVKAALAMQRLSAIGISICAILIGLLQAATNPTAILTAWHTSLGKLFLLLGSGLVVVGLLWMLHLARERE
jgi:Flp pilus assembly protein TadB